MSKDKQSAGDSVTSSSATQTGNAIAPQAAPAGLYPCALPLRAGHLPLRELIELYMSAYSGRDPSRIYRLTWWQAQLGDLQLLQLSDDDIHDALDALANQPARYYAGQDASGNPIHKAKRRPLSPASINRYAASLAAVITWAIKRRIAPKGYVHPCRTIERRTEHNERVRFLSDEERQRLLQACRESRWPMLYLLVLMAMTSGARKGELLALHWQDLDLDRGLAHCGRTKNGDRKTLALVPAVIEECRKFLPAKGAALLFASQRVPQAPFAFEQRWREALAKAKLRNFRFHDLRHTCASMLAQSGATLLEIAEVLGHRQLQVTKRYSHLTTGHKSALVNRVWGELTL